MTAKQHRTKTTIAITRDIPHSFVHALAEVSDSTTTATEQQPVSFWRARQQHENYVQTLQKIVPTVVRLPALEQYPDSLFVEDTVVAIEHTALVTHPGHSSRRGEVHSMQTLLQSLGMNVVNMQTLDPNAICDGGDVLWTNRHLFVGISQRTNQAAADVLAQTFPQHTVHPVSWPIHGPPRVLHLKSAVTHIDPYTLLAPEGPLGDAILQAMQATTLGYHVVRLPNPLACNVVTVNGVVLAQPCPQSRDKLEAVTRERQLQLEFVDTSELAKKDAALTCCNVLLCI